MPIATAARPHPLATCTPLGDRVIVKIDKVAETSHGGIILPEAVIRNERPQTGVVKAVGPGRKIGTEAPEVHLGDWPRMPLDVEVGQRVLFLAYAGAKYDDPKYDGEDDYLILREEDIMGVLAPTDTEDDRG